MSITSDAAEMARSGISPEDIAVNLKTTPAVIRVLLNRRNSNGRHIHISLPENVYDEIETIARDAGCNVKTACQMILIEEIRRKTYAIKTK